MQILIHSADAEQWQTAIAKALPTATVISSHVTLEARHNADYLVAWQPPGWLFEEQKGLKGIINLGAGVDALLNNPALPAGVPIVKLRDAGMADPMIDYVRYAVLHFQRDFDRYARQQARIQWQEQPLAPKAEWGIGVLGLGAIGARVAQTLAADGFPVHGWSRRPKALDGIRCYHGEEGLATLLGQVKSLVTLLPNTPATRDIINAETLAALPPGASLINPGRGSLIDEAALLEALGPVDAETRSGKDDGNGDTGRLRGAVLDAFAYEPLPADSPLWRHPRVLITPHMAAPTPRDAALEQVIDTLKAWQAGEQVPSVDPAAGY
ncbi:glyoxylate/hydroxypyruvate reductase A [Onishia taeanensis]|uniref:Glyoxylate/hydroxypyruvate reductase A n=1 Tax=Onishia taeanensis TaxID=284577 RepID=A0A328XVB3_9GAMM|nr:glyoxylate/hydroxypyruvate reductase A [Halomonas taeanensis]RAR63081.1 glyoxylate/hydroxypyruvate reductase A [Halomonas taeanensis]